jgi:hypothetical protein
LLRIRASLSNVLSPLKLRGPTWVLAIALAAVFSVPSARESAAAEGADPAERWIPSLNIGVTDVHHESAHGFIDSNVGFSRGYSESGDVTLLRLGVELLSPRYEGLFGKPYFFGRAGIQLAPTRLVANSGNLTGGGDPQQDVDDYLDDRANIPATPKRDADSFSNQGSDISARYVNPAFYLGLGVAFPLPLESIEIRLRPSLEYMGEGIRVQGRLNAVEEPAPDVFNVSMIEETDFQIYHALGLGFELEMFLKTEGRMTVSLFAQSRFLWSVGSRDVKFGDNAGVVSFSYHRQRSSLRGGVGVRLGWQGSSAN